MELEPGCEMTCSCCCCLWMPGVLLQSCQNTQAIYCIVDFRNLPQKPASEGRSFGFSFWNPCSLTQLLTFVTTWPSALIRNPSQSALKISSLSSVCMFLHSSTSQSSLPGYHNSHSVPQPQTQPPAKLPHPASRVKVSWLCPPPCSLFHCLSKRLSLWFMSGSFNMRWKGCFWF